MKSKYLLAGLSALAFSTGVAQAQNNDNGTSSSGQNNTASCNNATTASNSFCRITQTGSNNNGSITQTGSRQSATITQTGNFNSSTITQDSGAINANQTTLNNEARNTQNSDRNSSTIAQTGFRGSVTVTQTGLAGAASALNNSTVDQRNQIGSSSTATNTAAGNIVAVTQGKATTGGAINTSSIIQAGLGNSIVVDQAGDGLNSAIYQGAFVAGAPDVGRGNVARVTMRDVGGFSQIDQNAGNTAQTVSGNLATVDVREGSATTVNTSIIQQFSSFNSVTNVVRGGNNAGAGQPAQGNSSTVIQRFSTATADGAAATTTSGSETIRGRSDNEAFVSLSRTLSGVGADQQGSQQISSVTQDGRLNYAEAVITSGRSGTDPGSGASDPTTGRSGGNSSSVVQQGASNGTSGVGSVAIVTIGQQRGGASLGFGNSTTISQNAGLQTLGRSSTAQAPQSTTREGVTITETQAGQGAFARGQFAQTFQFGRYGVASVTQSDQNGAAGGGTVYSNGQVARSRAAITQGGELNTATVSQNGDNYAEVVQGRNNAEDRFNTVTVSQTDAGDGAATAGPGGTDVFGNPINQTGPGARAFNVFSASQFGGRQNPADATAAGQQGNSIVGNQNSVGAFATAFQRTQTYGQRIDIDQGGGRAVTSLTNNGVALNGATAANSAGIASGGSTAIVEQGAASGPVNVGNNNFASVSQDGRSNVTRVNQAGTNAFGVASASNTPTGPQTFVAGGFGLGVGAQANSVGNIVTVAQVGTANRATARQNLGTGRSGATGPSSSPTDTGGAPIASGDAYVDQFRFAGGARSAEIQIFQSNTNGGATNNQAEVDQAGLGQFARIEQSGQRNLADIDQRSGATNATAVIRQTGNDNTFYVVQTNPGQFIVATQSGNNNGVNSITSSGAGGGFGFTPVP